MKSKKTFQYCEYCDKAWEDTSPPTEEAYKSQRIEIEDGTVLRKKPRKDSHMLHIEGIFCNIECLKKFIEKNL